MDYNDKWKKIEELGEGGQGKLYRVIDISKFGSKRELQRQLRVTITHLAGGGPSFLQLCH